MFTLLFSHIIILFSIVIQIQSHVFLRKKDIIIFIRNLTSIIVAISSLNACSNSESTDNYLNLSINNSFENDTVPQIIDYLPIDDSDYSYANIPRIVIKTKNYKSINDKDTDIPAELQMWGKNSPESEILNLTIKGRGNSSWWYPKKPYTIKFQQDQSFGGMPKAKKWVMLANYRDRTLIRNAVALELARLSSLEWTPQGFFADVFFNNNFIGNYYICEKIEVSKNRLNIGEDAFLLEFDTYYDEKYKFKSKYYNLPVNIKHPKILDSTSLLNIKDYIDSAEFSLKHLSTDKTFLKYFDINSFADYFLIYALTNNGEPTLPKSFYIHKSAHGKLTAGPVWDFDFGTFNVNSNGISNTHSEIFKNLLLKNEFKDALRQKWAAYKNNIIYINTFIDSLAVYLRESNEMNIKRWPITINDYFIGDEKVDYDSAIYLIKQSIQNKVYAIDDFCKNI